MKETANVEYFYLKCNEVLGTAYTAGDWGGADNVKETINVEWLAAAVQIVYQRIHSPKSGCHLLLSSRFNPASIKMAVPIEVVNSVVEYLKNLNKPCDNDCACYRDKNCNCVCASHCNCNGNCSATCGSSRTANHCNCTGSYNCNCNCACECGSNTECVCDCQPYDCNCSQVLNCNIGSSRPMTQNCGSACNCNCACQCECPPPPPPPPPTNATVNLSSSWDKLTISWTAAPNAASYNVYAHGDTSVLIGTTTSTSFEDFNFLNNGAIISTSGQFFVKYGVTAVLTTGVETGACSASFYEQKVIWDFYNPISVSFDYDCNTDKYYVNVQAHCANVRKYTCNDSTNTSGSFSLGLYTKGFFGSVAIYAENTLGSRYKTVSFTVPFNTP